MDQAGQNAFHLKAWQAWGYYSSTQYFYYIHCWMEVSGEFDTPTALPPEQNPNLLLDNLLRVPRGPRGDFGKGRFLALTDNQITPVRFSSQYHSYRTN